MDLILTQPKSSSERACWSETKGPLTLEKKLAHVRTLRLMLVRARVKRPLSLRYLWSVRVGFLVGCGPTVHGDYNPGQKAWYTFLTLSLFPPPPSNVESVCRICPPLSNIVWGKGGGPRFRERAAFVIEQGTTMKHCYFQSVPHTFDQSRVAQSPTRQIQD